MTFWSLKDLNESTGKLELKTNELELTHEGTLLTNKLNLNRMKKCN